MVSEVITHGMNFNTESGSTLKMKSQRIPKRKVKSSILKQVKDGDFAKMFASKEAREKVSKYEGIKNKATSKLNSVYEEILPIIELYGRENQDVVHTSVAKTWVEANCSKYKADLDLYFSVIKNVMCLVQQPTPPQNEVYGRSMMLSLVFDTI